MFNFFLGVAVAVLLIGGIIGFVFTFFGISVHSGRIEALEKANKKLTDYWKRTDQHAASIRDLHGRVAYMDTWLGEHFNTPDPDNVFGKKYTTIMEIDEEAKEP